MAETPAAYPLRVQRSRRKGSSLPPNTVCVSRPGRWGNPFRPAPLIETEALRLPALTAADCVRLFRENLTARLDKGHAWRSATLRELRGLTGRNLACWCHLCPAHAAGKPLAEPCADCAPCHADPLGEIANSALVCEAIDG